MFKLLDILLDSFFYIILFVSFTIMLFSSVGKAAPLNAVVSGVDITITYEEPVLNEDGSILVDLDKTTIYAQPDNGLLVLQDVPASSVNGGAIVTQILTFPVNDGEETNITIWVTPTDISGNEGLDSPRIIERIDRLSPMAIQ